MPLCSGDQRRPPLLCLKRFSVLPQSVTGLIPGHAHALVAFLTALTPGHTCFSGLATLGMDILEMGKGGAYLQLFLPLFPRATGLGRWESKTD